MRTAYHGGVEGTFTSLPFGDGQVISGSELDSYHYAMLGRDNESDTDYAQFRQHSNAQGRLMSPDPYYGSYDFTNPQSFNRYAYALNNPLALFDPSGFEDDSGCPDDENCFHGRSGDAGGGYDGGGGDGGGSARGDGGDDCPLCVDTDPAAPPDGPNQSRGQLPQVPTPYPRRHRPQRPHQARLGDGC
jgi:RHS repeat-associated protein